MNKFSRWIKSWLTMKRKDFLFVDVVSGDSVYRYVDCYGQEWMAEYSRWGFRVKHNSSRKN